MFYRHENYNVTINAHGAEQVLESLGFKKEESMSKNKTTAGTKKFPLASKKTLTRASEKFRVETLKGARSAINSGDAKDASRAVLMQQVRDRGVKNFRVMNKEELQSIVNGATPQQIEAIQLSAVTRWKAGWSKNKVATNAKA